MKKRRQRERRREEGEEKEGGEEEEEGRGRKAAFDARTLSAFGVSRNEVIESHPVIVVM